MFDKGLYITQWIVYSSMIFLLYLSANSAQAGDWQEEMLYHPSADQLVLEEEGRIVIYDGMTSRQISLALDIQFDRIDSMMFVRTVVTDDKGEALKDKDSGQQIVEDDGC
ncbi:MAG: hypothetical protein P8103_06910 [Candidatus Thiodiazotropha sp.]